MAGVGIRSGCSGCAGTVTWQELELGADVDTNTTYTDVYLVCNGTGDVTPPDEPEEEECQAPNGQTYTESCPAGQTGTITYTWVGEPTCSYKKTDNCASSCTPSYGSWKLTAAPPADTCDGNANAEYTCSGGKKGTCIDVKTVSSDKQDSYVENNDPSDSEGDSCPDYDPNSTYTCKDDDFTVCNDVYESGLKGYFANMNPYGESMLRLKCWNNSIQTSGDWCDFKWQYDTADNICQEKLRQGGLYLLPGEHYTCGIADTHQLCINMGWNSTHDAYPTSWLVCENITKSRTVSCYPDSFSYTREVTCCGD